MSMTTEEKKMIAYKPPMSMDKMMVEADSLYQKNIAFYRKEYRTTPPALSLKEQIIRGLLQIAMFIFKIVVLILFLAILSTL